MIVTCEECSTRFNLDDTLIKGNGSKVRCSVCQQVFTVFPTPLELEVESDPTPVPPISSDQTIDSSVDAIDDTEFDETPDFEMEDNDFSLEDSELDFETPDLELDEDGGLALDEPDDLEMDEPEDIEPDELEIDELEPDELEPDELEPDELEIGNFEDDEDFSFDPSMEDEEELDLQLEDNSIDEDSTLDFDDADPDEFDGIEFEPLHDDDADFSAIEDDEPALALEESGGLELEIEPEIEDKDLADSVAENGADDFSAEDDFELEFDVSDEDQIDDDQSEGELSVGDGLDIEIDAEINNDESPKEDKLGSEPSAFPTITPEEDFSEYDDVLEQETEPDLEFGEPETIETEDVVKKESAKTDEPEAKQQTRRRHTKKKPLIGKPVLVLILLFLLVAGAYIASLMTGYQIPYLSEIKIPFIEDLVKTKSTEAPDIKPIPNQKSVNGRFVTNSTAGTLFVITGTVENPSKTAYSHIEIKGALITKDKTEAKIKTAFCGNIITEEMLKTGNITDINKLLSVKEGHHNSNVNIKPGAAIPFMIVFSDLPEKLQNFTVKVSNFTKTQAN